MGSTGVTGVVIAVAVLALVLYRQTVARPVSPRRLIILPGILIVLGVIALSNVHHGHLTGTEVAYVAADLVWSVASGVGRGLCVRVFSRDGVMWRQGTAVTIALWLVSIAGRVVIAVLASRAGVADISNAALDLSFGLSLLCQNGMVALRGQRLGIPFAIDAPRR